MNYNRVSSLEYECNCTQISQGKWDRLMLGSRRADKAKIDRLVKIHLPELYRDLALEYYNPNYYYRTKTHFVLVHSSIEYFIRFKN